MFRVKTLSAPSVFRAIFIENKDIHNYDTRQREKFHVPSVKRNYMQRTISYRGYLSGIISQSMLLMIGHCYHLNLPYGNM